MPASGRQRVGPFAPFSSLFLERFPRGDKIAHGCKRSFDELGGFLFRSQVFPNGAVLLTGTGVVPPDDFTLQEKDEVEIQISGIGTLWNPVTVV
jgi:2-dehydro-3-deoxy-D-arabinonate dehydratase